MQILLNWSTPGIDFPSSNDWTMSFSNPLLLIENKTNQLLPFRNIANWARFFLIKKKLNRKKSFVDLIKYFPRLNYLHIIIYLSFSLFNSYQLKIEMLWELNKQFFVCVFLKNNGNTTTTALWWWKNSLWAHVKFSKSEIELKIYIRIYKCVWIFIGKINKIKLKT